MSANDRGDTTLPVPLKLGRKAVAPQQIEAEVSWTFGSKRFKEVISIAVE